MIRSVSWHNRGLNPVYRLSIMSGSLAPQSPPGFTPDPTMIGDPSSKSELLDIRFRSRVPLTGGLEFGTAFSEIFIGPEDEHADRELFDAWTMVQQHPHHRDYLYQLYLSSRRKYGLSDSDTSRWSVNWKFQVLYVVLRIANKCEEMGLGELDWWPIASEDDLMMLRPYMKRVDWTDVPTVCDIKG